jgi:asparagine synthase (glutamine-hydrolysing)
MCGIAGVISLNKKIHSVSTVKNMTNIMQHRGPDGEGFWTSEQSDIIFGHRRLSIIDLSDNGAQPLIRNNYVITYNGEVYNYKELREQLISFGFIFKSACDTEVIINAYIHWGEKCVDYFNGMWAFTIFDPIKNQIFCSRDRYGIKPFYYFITNDQFYFASEIKAFSVLEDWSPRVNKNMAYDFLYNGFVNHTNETFFENIFEMRGGNNLIINFEKSSFSINQYYFIEKIQPLNELVDENILIEKYRNLFDSAVQLTLRSDVKLGSALSGGIDSSSLVASMNNEFKDQNLPFEQECVAACFNEKDIDESEYVDAVTNKLNINAHKVYPTFLHFENDFAKLIWHQEEPFPTMSIFAQYCVFEEAAKQNLTVMLNGQGADEILAGYDSFYRPYFTALFKNNIFKGISTLYNYWKLHSRFPIHNIIKNIFKNKFKNNYNKYFNTNYFNLVTPYIRPIDSTIRNTSFNHLNGYGLHSLLRYEDRNSMTFSIESRVPFLDYRVVDFGISLPDNIKINNGIRKYILRESFKDILPENIYKRYDKFGFLTPQEVWTKSNSIFFKDELNKAIKNCKSIFSNEVLEAYEKNITSKEYIYFIWRIVCFNKWVEVYKVSL